MKPELIASMLELLPSSIPELQEIKLSDDHGYIEVFTRTGGEKRGPFYRQNEELRNHPLNIGDEDVEGSEYMARFTFDYPEEYDELVKSRDEKGLEKALDARRPIIHSEDDRIVAVRDILSDENTTTAQKLFRLVQLF